MRVPMDGKVALVTGASRGLGRRFVGALVAAGAKIAAVARPSAELADLEARHGGYLVASGCDLGDGEAVTAAVIQTVQRFGRLREDAIRVSVLRLGSVTGSTGARDWDPATTRAFAETIARTGHAASGAAASPESMAEALLAVLSLPEDLNVDIIEVRAAAGRPAVAEAPMLEGEPLATH